MLNRESLGNRISLLQRTLARAERLNRQEGTFSSQVFLVLHDLEKETSALRFDHLNEADRRGPLAVMVQTVAGR